MRFLVLPLLMSFLFIGCHKTAEKKVALPQTPPPPAAAAPASSGNSPTTEQKKPDEPKVVAPKDLKAENLCRSFKEYGILVPKVLLKPLLTATSAAILIPESLYKCLGKNASESALHFAGFSYDDPKPFYFFINPQIRISAATEKISLDAAVNDAQKFAKLGLEKKEDAISFYRKFYGAENLKHDWILLDLSVSDKNLSSVIFFAPQQHPYAQTVNKTQVQELIEGGAEVIDVRPKADFDRKHVPSAKNSPSVEKLNGSALSTDEQRAAGYAIYPGFISDDRSKKIVVLNQNPISFSAYNTITFLKSQGYENLFFFWEGMDVWDGGSSIVTPQSMDSVTLLSYNEFKERLNNPNVVVVDVRSANKALAHAFPKAINISFKETKNEFKQPLYRAEALTYAFVHQNEKGFENPLPSSVTSTKKIVLVGDHRYDWKPYKAASWLKRDYAAVIEIYRDGYKGWKFFTSFENAQKKYHLKRKLGPAIAKANQGSPKPRTKPVRTMRSDGTRYPKAQLVKGISGTSAK